MLRNVSSLYMDELRAATVVASGTEHEEGQFLDGAPSGLIIVAGGPLLMDR